MNKMFKYKILLFIFFFLFVKFLFSQEVVDSQQLIEDLIENIAESSDEELDYTSLFDDFNFFINNPLNLNIATEEDLEKLHILNDFQIKSLLRYISKNGQMLSIYELQLVYGFTPELIQKILPFITVSSKTEAQKFSLKRAVRYGSNQYFLRVKSTVEDQEGFMPISDSALMSSPNSRYLGNRLKIYTRYKYHYKNKIAYGFTAEKDPGEEFFKGTQKNGFDFYSVHLQLSNFGHLKTLVVGDYKLRFGQGLNLWSGMATGKSSYVLDVKRKAQGISKYSSADENNFMRGAAATVSFKDFNFSTFISKKKIDANLSEADTLDEEVRYVSSFLASGIHATPSQLYDKHAIDENLFGGNITFNKKAFKVGVTYVKYKYGADLVKTITPYNQFDFTGSENSNLSLDYQFGIRNIYFFGELARSFNGAMAYINGAVASIAPQMSVSIVHRDYARDYQALYSNAFAENTKNVNEKGIYIGTEIHPIKHWKISAYYDTYKFPWIKSGASALSNGVDYLAQVDFRLSRKVQMYWRIKNETKSLNVDEEELTNPSDAKYLVDVSNLHLRYNISYKVLDELQLKNRIELVRFTKGDADSENGYLIYQDIIYHPKALPLNVSFRYGIFDTDSYNARIYAYETDVLYAYSIPAYSTKGVRTYLTLKYSLNKIDFWLRYAQTYYSNKSVIGSGLNEITGKTKTELTFQLRYKF
ncbi:MAG: hypothetical protein DRJ01_04105 [Bacteroidetes bacterium]|nr:MAG: hypothetical protein DRJ01_04105 [Bacteroidota bacterium]